MNNYRCIEAKNKRKLKTDLRFMHTPANLYTKLEGTLCRLICMKTTIS
jgi:hypothetical protein